MWNRPIVEQTGGGIGICLIQTAGFFGHWLSLFQHRGFWHILRFIGGFAFATDMHCIIKLDDDAFIKINFSDPYWARIIARDYVYEPEIERVLLALKQINYCFIDCGSNIGYWSILVGSERFGKKNAYAFEAGHETFKCLQQNRHLNGNGFSTLNLAVTRQSGQTVEFQKGSINGGSHAAARVSNMSISDQENCLALEKVNTISLDDIAYDVCKDQKQVFVIKLDIEGQEVEALHGATYLLQSDVLFIYEDHGMDESCEATKFFLAKKNFKVFFLDDDGAFIEIISIREVQTIKRRKNFGYNFFACSDSIWNDVSKLIQKNTIPTT